MTGGYGPDDMARWVTEEAGDSERSAFARDRARILHSASFRRLAAKTQIHAAGTADFPRTRLTHTLEVAQIGRELAVAVGADPDVVDAAGLAHDLGHPPYGHNGERVLDEVAAPAGGFEGNAQTLRVLTRLEAKRIGPPDGPRAGESVGLNLTRAALDAATKYPWPRPDGAGDAPKFGVYQDDLDVFGWLRTGAPGERRCLEAQVMDFADDVAYSVHDLEDALHAHHVDLAMLHAAAAEGDPEGVVALAGSYQPDAGAAALQQALRRLLRLSWWPASYDGSRVAQAALKGLTSALIGRFCRAAQSATVAAYGRRSARYGADLLVPETTRQEVAVLKAVANRYVMQRAEAQAAYAAQRELLAELCAGLLGRAPRHLEPPYAADFAAATDDAGRVRAVVDQVASLTDTSVGRWLDAVRPC